MLYIHPSNRNKLASNAWYFRSATKWAQNKSLHLKERHLLITSGINSNSIKLRGNSLFVYNKKHGTSQILPELRVMILSLSVLLLISLPVQNQRYCLTFHLSLFNHLSKIKTLIIYLHLLNFLIKIVLSAPIPRSLSDLQQLIHVAAWIGGGSLSLCLWNARSQRLFSFPITKMFDFIYVTETDQVYDN